MSSHTHRFATYLDKGGTGKTTSAAHFGAALGHEGHRVLLIDLAGKQGDLAKIFGVHEQLDEDDWPNIATVFQPEWDKIAERIEEKFGSDPIDELLVDTDEPVDLIPAHEGLDSLDIELESKYSGSDKYKALDEFLDRYVDDRYDVVILDLPGAPNNITYNGVWAAQHLLVPVRAGLLESEQAEVLEGDLEDLLEKHGRDVEISMLLPTMIETHTKLGTKYLEEYAEKYPDVIAPEPIPNSQDIVNATHQGMTLFALDEDEMLKTAVRARDAYQTDATELLSRIK